MGIVKELSLTYFERGSITVRLVSSLTGLHSTKIENMQLYVLKLAYPNHGKSESSSDTDAAMILPPTVNVLL